MLRDEITHVSVVSQGVQYHRSNTLQGAEKISVLSNLTRVEMLTFETTWEDELVPIFKGPKNYRLDGPYP